MDIPDISVSRASNLADDAAKAITILLQTFEAMTGCQIHSVPIDRVNKVLTVRVKVQLP